MRCPDCGSKLRMQDSRDLAGGIRVDRLWKCQNKLCGAVRKSHDILEETPVKPSMMKSS